MSERGPVTRAEIAEAEASQLANEATRLQRERDDALGERDEAKRQLRELEGKVMQ